MHGLRADDTASQTNLCCVMLNNFPGRPCSLPAAILNIKINFDVLFSKNIGFRSYNMSSHIHFEYYARTVYLHESGESETEAKGKIPCMSCKSETLNLKTKN